MQLTYQHANPDAGNESTVLRFRSDSGRSTTLLVDAGRDVDLDRVLGETEHLDAVLLTHAHIDHYWSLGDVVEDGVPVYATPATVDALELAMPEATRDAGIASPDTALDALTPIEDWTTLDSPADATDIVGRSGDTTGTGSTDADVAGADDGPAEGGTALDDPTDAATGSDDPAVELRPVPAGHAPGAGGFLLRFRPGSDDGPLPSREDHVLVSGDFTTRPACGYPGLDPDPPVDVGAVLLNVSTRPDYADELNRAIEASLEQAFAGSPTLVTASALTGVHFAALCGRAAAALDRSLPVRVVGQTAKLWTALDLELADVDVEPTPEFDRPEAVLDPGTLTVAGPAAPTTGSAGRLCDALSGDGSAALVQLIGGASDPFEGFSGTSRAFELVDHPTDAALDAFVEELSPLQVVVNHARAPRLEALRDRYDDQFVWATERGGEHVLFEDGEWVGPPWLGEETLRQIKTRHWKRSRGSSPPAPELPDVGFSTVDPVAEGVGLEALRERFAGSPSEAYGVDAGDGDADGAGRSVTAGAEGSEGADVEGSEAAAAAESEAAEADGGEATTSTPTATDASEGGAPPTARDADFERAVLERLDSIQAALTEGQAIDEAADDVRVPARVLRGGDEVLLQLHEDVDVPAGEVVAVRIESVDGAGTDPADGDES